MDNIKEKLARLSPFLNEYQRRVVFAAESESFGFGGKALISKLTGMFRVTINKGLKDYHSGTPLKEGQVRNTGGGRHSVTENDPSLLQALENLIEPVTRGDPESALRWTIKSVRSLSDELTKQGHKVGKSVVSRLLIQLGYSLQSNLKKVEGRQHPDRNAQFEHINAQAESYITENQPVYL